MRSSSPALCVLALIAGCQTLGAIEPGSEPVSALSPARRIWEQGQEAMRLGQPDKAIACYKQSLELDPKFAQAHLSLAAARLEIGDDAGACPHLGLYVEARPEQVAVRGHYAELLYRLKHIPQAREQFERFVVDAQEQDGPVAKNLLHCHSRLMEIGAREDDEYAEHLNRGIGLLLLARARAELSEDANDLTREGLLCKAAGELTLALQERGDEARPRWYLYEVWSALAQRQLAKRWLRETVVAAPFSYLTPAERLSLQLAQTEPGVTSLRR